MSSYLEPAPAGPVKPVTVPWVRAQKGRQRLSMLTAYDYPMATLIDRAGVDMVLVGDSLGPVMYGEPNTLSVTMEDMLRHGRAVSHACRRALVIGDLPFMSYQVSREQAISNAGRFLKEARVKAVKLEGGSEVAELVRDLSRAGIPVCGHIGLTPQSIHAMGTYRMHGKTPDERHFLLQSARDLADAGAFAIVLECVEAGLAAEISRAVPVPTIGIGSGTDCDGQVLVTHDLLGLTIGHVPRFVTPTASLGEAFLQGVAKYVERTRAEGAATPADGRADVLSH
ncbi:MAG: 3-methyl-2-oxobutanoate hydroxymethyltransferase [Bacteriovoracia bacterium]